MLDLTITSLETITAFDIQTGNLKFVLDELQNASIANSEEKVDITGKQGRKLSSLKRNKAVTISGTNGMLSAGLLAAQTGSELTRKETEVLWTDYLTVGSANTAVISYKAIGTVGAEIEELWIKSADGALDTRLEQDASASAGKFSYAPDTKTLTFNSDVAAGTEIAVYYKRKISADVLENRSDIHGTKVMMYVDALGEDKCGNVFRVQFYLPKVDFSGEFSIDLGDNQTVHAFEAESLSGGCGGGMGTNLYTFTIFGANAEDAA